MSVYALILAGGAGTRFWPASRMKRPKQLLPLTGSRPLIVETIERVLPLTGGWERVFIASGTSVADATRAMLPLLPRDNLLVEPIARNTAPCIAWGASIIARLDPFAVVMVLPSDHHIEDTDAFRAALEAAVESARGGTITTIGLAPTRPETGFGYIEVASAIDGADLGAPKPVEVVRFTEKPTREVAQGFVDGKKHLWNGGMFFFRARDMVEAVERHMPDWAEELRTVDEAVAGGTGDNALATAFSRAPSVSIDYAIMEKMERLAVVPASIGWSDVGSWEAAAELAQKGDGDNAAPSSTVFVDSSRNYVVDMTTRPKTARKVIALVGVDDLCVVETDDALLIVPRSRCQDVKLVVDALKGRGDLDSV